MAAADSRVAKVEMVATVARVKETMEAQVLVAAAVAKEAPVVVAAAAPVAM